jgi:hypothetical protein
VDACAHGYAGANGYIRAADSYSHGRSDHPYTHAPTAHSHANDYGHGAHSYRHAHSDANGDSYAFTHYDHSLAHRYSFTYDHTNRLFDAIAHGDGDTFSRSYAHRHAHADSHGYRLIPAHVYAHGNGHAAALASFLNLPEIL